MEFVNLVEKVTEKKIIDILGVSFQVLPGVFSPIYSSDTAWFAQQLIPLVKGKKFLEIGSGSGVISCLASIHGAFQVVAIDINPQAIENTRQNATLYSLDISVREGSVFDPITKGELFDIIFWNHPFSCADKCLHENDMLMASVFDAEYKGLRTFFEKGKYYLSKNGSLILGTSSIARLQLIKKIAKNEGYTVTLLGKVEVPVYKGKKVTMDLRVYGFTAR